MPSSQQMGRVVVLNGPPRSGKSSIARAIQETFDGVWMNLGVDVFMEATPERYRPGIGLRPGGERPDLEPLIPSLYEAMYDSVAAHARRGLDAVVDVDHHDWYSTPLRVLVRVAPMLVDLDAMFVGLRCPTATIMERRDETGWTRAGPLLAGTDVPEAVERWQAAVHDPGIYDLDVDTSVVSPYEAAEAIARHLERGERHAFRRIAAIGGA